MYKPIEVNDAINRLFYLLNIHTLPLKTLSYSQIRSYAFAKSESNGIVSLKDFDALITAISYCINSENNKLRMDFIDRTNNSFKEEMNPKSKEVIAYKRKASQEANRKMASKLNIK